jgi:hypothetical protein
MLKILELLTRKDGITHEQFYGALFIGPIKTYVIDERQIIPPPGSR